MALQVWDGFDHYKDLNDLKQRSGFLQWQIGLIPGGTTVGFNTPGRNGFGKSMFISGVATTPEVFAVFGQRVSSAFTGFGALFPGASIGAGFRFYDTVSNIVNVEVYFNPVNYAVQVYRGSRLGGGTLLYASPNNAWTGQVWNFVEIWPVIASGTSGSVQVRVNGDVVANVTGVNTQSGGAAAWWDMMSIVGYNAAGTGFQINLDDLYYGDTTTGAGLHACNVPIGDARVDTEFPVGNSSVQWTPLANTNWQEVSETAMDSDTSYNFTSTPGNEDLLNFGAMENTIVTIYGVQVTGAYRKDDAGMRVVKQALKSGATEVYGASNSVPDTSYAYFTDPWILDPHTSLNWTLTAVNALAAGYNLVS